jgi:hypothetical protein
MLGFEGWVGWRGEWEVMVGDGIKGSGVAGGTVALVEKASIEDFTITFVVPFWNSLT